MLEDEIVIMNVERYIEVYSNETDQLLYSYKITIPDHLVIEIVSPDEDDEFALFSYVLTQEKVISLGGRHIVDEYHNKDVGYYVACYQAQNIQIPNKVRSKTQAILTALLFPKMIILSKPYNFIFTFSVEISLQVA